jgi:phenylalanyl-tRNA synthetase beta chain
MRVSLNWLAELVEVPPLEELSDRLTQGGLQVEQIERLGTDFEGVVVARIVASQQHPDADRLSVTEVLAGAERLQIVCGAKNYRVGDLVPLARVGSRLPGGRAIEAATLRGVASQGMLCSQSDLGISEEGEGLWILPEGLSPGSPLADSLGLRDTVLEVNVTANRSDCLSHLGVAREVAALTGRSLRPAPEVGKIPVETGAAPSPFPPPEIQATERCGLYLGQEAHAEGLNAASPPWLAARLRACGLRPLGFAVDVTNFVMLELGQPLHAFALASIRQGIRVRLARVGERLTTLDGVERELTGEDLLICDGDRPIALAGVMGSVESGIPVAAKGAPGPAAADIYLEAAWFHPLGIRRTARRLGIRSDASHRFERGVDPALPARALDRALGLLGAELPDLRKGAPQRGEGQRPHPKPVGLRFEKVGALLGHPVSADESRGLLSRLEIREVGSELGATLFSIPSYRFDLDREVDLIEEIARLQGFDRIGSRIAPRSVAPPRRTVRDEAVASARRALAAHGFSEAVNFSFLSGPAVEPFLAAPGAERPVKLLNAIRVDQAAMRTSLLPSLCQNVRHNLAHLNQVHGLPPSVRLYELARVYRWRQGEERSEGPAVERLRLGLVACGARSPLGWGAGRAAVDVYDLKGAVEALLEAIGVAPAAVRFERGEAPFLHPRSSMALWLKGQNIGLLGEIHPGVAEGLGLPVGLLLAELDAEPLFGAAQPRRFEGLPRFPAVLRDLALVFPEQVAAAQVETSLRSAAEALLEDLQLFDVYRGPPLAAGTKSLAYSLRFRSADLTLTDEEVVGLCERMVDAVAASLGGSLRK